MPIDRHASKRIQDNFSKQDRDRDQTMPNNNRAFLDREAPVLITGAWGMLGRSLHQSLHNAGFKNILVPRRVELDLLDQQATFFYLQNKKPVYVFHLASVVFGLLGNARNQIKSLTENTILNHNIIMSSSQAKVKKFFFAGSVASYPYPFRTLPLDEKGIWDGAPHPGEFGYAHAKRHALTYLELLDRETGMDFLYGLITNLYGPEDSFDEQNGHVIPSLVKKMHDSQKSLTNFEVWGDGSATRDFMYIDDAAFAILTAFESISGVANICSGVSISIRSVVEALVEASNFQGKVEWQTDKPVGVPVRSVSDARLRNIGFASRFDIKAGMAKTWDWYTKNHAINL